MPGSATPSDDGLNDEARMQAAIQNSNNPQQICPTCGGSGVSPIPIDQEGARGGPKI